jgi:hypothetical protein
MARLSPREMSSLNAVTPVYERSTERALEHRHQAREQAFEANRARLSPVGDSPSPVRNEDDDLNAQFRQLCTKAAETKEGKDEFVASLFKADLGLHFIAACTAWCGPNSLKLIADRCLLDACEQNGAIFTDDQRHTIIEHELSRLEASVE